MNNSAFRNIVTGNATSADSKSKQDQNGEVKKPSVALGSRMRSSIPMTPRNIPGQRQNVHSEFARQVAAATSASQEGPPLKKFKASAAPKGTRLASGYTDRASLLRNNAEDGKPDLENKEQRLKALEEMYKLQQIDLETLETLRSEMGIGGDVSSTHLVRGLDWKLLARVKRGEDVTKSDTEDAAKDEDDSVDVDAEFDKALENEIVQPAIQSKSATDDENMVRSPTEVKTSRSMTRDEILKQFKKSRKDPHSTSLTLSVEAPVLNDKFKKIPAKATGVKKEKFIEIVNGRRREVLLITNPDGTIKRKSRWLDPETPNDIVVNPIQPQEELSQNQSPKVKHRKSRKEPADVLGMEVPVEIAAREASRQAEAAAAEEDDDDIFQGVGDDYDPLGDINSNSSEEEGAERISVTDQQYTTKDDGEHITDQAAQPVKKRNYFTSSTDEEVQPIDKNNPIVKDPTMLQALKRAADIRKREETSSDIKPQNSNDKSAAFLAKLRESERQDAADLDMGFGDSRFDEEDEEGGDLFAFDHEGDDEPEGKRKPGGGRKRGSKKRKGDKNSFADVMGAIERRKQ